MRQVKLNYEAVYSRVRMLHSNLAAQLREMDTGYRNIQSSLRCMDSHTNAEIMATVEANQEKARVTAECLQRLLIFIESATREVEQEEANWTRIFNEGARNRIQRTGDDG